MKPVMLINTTHIIYDIMGSRIISNIEYTFRGESFENWHEANSLEFISIGYWNVANCTWT